MSEAKHTPGPWEVSRYGKVRNDSELDFVRAMSTSIVLSSTAHSRRIPQSERRANANLIAAAPELLEALEAMVEEWAPFADPINGSRSVAVVEAARAAIAKATGK